RIVGFPLPDSANPGVRRDGRRGEVGLSRAEVDHILARCLAALRFLRDRDGRGRLEVLQVGRQTGTRGHAREHSPAGLAGQPQFYSQAEAWARYDAALKGSALSGPPFRVGTTVPPLPFSGWHRTILRLARPLTTEARVTGVDAKAALERGRGVVLVCPPAPERAQQLWELVSPVTAGEGPGVGPLVLIICADDAAAAEWPAVAPAGFRVHAVTGLVRSASRLKRRPPQVLAGAVKDLAALVQRTALKLDHVASLVVAWPEALIAGEHAGPLD